MPRLKHKSTVGHGSAHITVVAKKDPDSEILDRILNYLQKNPVRAESEDEVCKKIGDCLGIGPAKTKEKVMSLVAQRLVTKSTFTEYFPQQELTKTLIEFRVPNIYKKPSESQKPESGKRTTERRGLWKKKTEKARRAGVLGADRAGTW